MNHDELNRLVTNAITRAANLPADSLEGWAALREVSALEEAIANVTPADNLEGEIARLGAVTAAVDAGEPLRAIQLAERFLKEGLAVEVTAKLEQAVKEAEAQLARAGLDEPTVEPVTFTVRAA